MAKRYNSTILSFQAGELSPEVLGRTDKPDYVFAMERITNGVVTRQGTIVRRGGIKFGGISPLAVPVAFRDGQGRDYVLMLNFSIPEDPADAGLLNPTLADSKVFFEGEEVQGAVFKVPFRVLQPDVLSGNLIVRTAQSGNLMIVTTNFTPPFVITRNAHDDWTLEGWRTRK